MNFISTLLTGIAFPAPPTLIGWLVWVSLLGILVYALYRWRAYQPVWKGREWGIFVVLFILIAITNLLIGVRLTSASARPLPGLPADAPGSALMVFSAIPWLLGGGLLGPVGGGCAWRVSQDFCAAHGIRIPCFPLLNLPCWARGFPRTCASDTERRHMRYYVSRLLARCC